MKHEPDAATKAQCLMALQHSLAHLTELKQAKEITLNAGDYKISVTVEKRNGG